MTPEASRDKTNPNYWRNELMKRIPYIPHEPTPKSNKLVDRVACCNPKIYNVNSVLVELKEQIRGMEHIFVVVEVSEEQKMNIWTFYLARKANIWWSAMKDKL